MTSSHVSGSSVDSSGCGSHDHEYSFTTNSNHDVLLVTIDGTTYIGYDKMGYTGYNYRISSLSPFTYKLSSSYEYTESPGEGKKFVLVEIAVKNKGLNDGLSIDKPELRVSSGNQYDYDYSASSHYSPLYNGLYDVKVGLGNTYRYCLVYEIPETEEASEVVWPSMYVDLRGYTYDETIPMDA